MKNKNSIYLRNMRNFLMYVPFLNQVAKIIYWMSITHKDDHFVKNNCMKNIIYKVSIFTIYLVMEYII